MLGRTGDAGSPSDTVGYDLVPVGIAVPFQRYLDFVTHQPNAAVRTAIDALVEGELPGALSPTERAGLVAATQQAILAAQLPPPQIQEIRTSALAAIRRCGHGGGCVTGAGVGPQAKDPPPRTFSRGSWGQEGRS